MGSGKETEWAGGEFGGIGLARRRAMTTQKRKVDVDSEGVVPFRADRGVEVTRLVAESSLRRREGRRAADILIDEHGSGAAKEMAHAHVAAEFDRTCVGAAAHALNPEQGLRRARHEHEFDALTTQKRSELRNLDVEANDDDAAHAAKRPETDTVAADKGGFPWREVQFVLMTEGEAIPDRRAVAKQSVRAEERHGAKYDSFVSLRQTRGEPGPEVRPEESCHAAELIFLRHERLKAHPEKFREHDEIRTIVPRFAHLRADTVSEGIGRGRGDADIEGQQGEGQAVHVLVQKVRVFGDSCSSPTSFQEKTACSSGRRR